ERRPGDPVDGAQVELFTALVYTDNLQHAAPQDSALVRVSVARTEADGGFQFHQLESGAYLVVVRDPALGRGEAWTSTAESDAVVKVIAPTRAIGRVLRRRIPVSNARVRFVPDALAWGVSVDPTEHITIDTYTDDTGRFVMGLPPKI